MVYTCTNESRAKNMFIEWLVIALSILFLLYLAMTIIWPEKF